MSRNSARKFLSGGAFALNAVLALAVVAPARAQTAPATGNPASDQPIHLDQLVVTGSNIPLAADELSVPVQVVGTEIIKDSGTPDSTLDLLRKVAPNLTGIGSENANIFHGTNFGGASVQLKNLPTLVLINGLRVANSPAESTGGYQFVDLNMIPPAAIERIEVLQDGASAVYGADAVGGVINLILKKDYNGWEFGGHFGFSRETGHYEERSGYLTGGVADDKTSITVSFAVAKQDPLFMSSRNYTNPIYGTYTYPGSIDVYNNLTGEDDFYQLAPGVNAPPGGAKYSIAQLVAMGVYVPLTSTQAFEELNLSKAQTLLQSLKRSSGMLTFDHKVFDDHLVAYGDILYSRTETWSQLNGQPLVPYVEDPWVDVNVFGSASSPPPVGTTYVPVTASTNPFSQTFLDGGQSTPESAPGSADGSGYDINARERFLNYPRVYKNDSDFYRLVGGLKGDIDEDYHWDISANIDRYTLGFTNPGLIDTSALNAALIDGQINPFAINQAAGAFNGVIGTAFVNMLSTMNDFNVKFNGTPFSLPAGQLGFAVGFEYVLEGLSAVPDINSLPNSSGTTQGWSNATTYQQFEANRDFDSFYGELNIPVVSPAMGVPVVYAADINGAVRYDSYSGHVGATTDPQGKLSWQPFDASFKLRASAGKSFIAPQLFNLYGPVSSGSSDNIAYTTASGGTNQAQFNQTGGANPNLKPSTANSWLAGFVSTPTFLKGLEISADYSDIFQRLAVGTVPAATVVQDVELAGAASPYADLVHFNSPTGPTPTAPGQISTHSPQQIYVIQNDLNLAGTRIDSTDFRLDYAFSTSYGKFDVSSAWTWYNRYRLQLIPTEQYYDYVGKASTTQGTTIPRWRTYTNIDWKIAGFDAFVGWTYVGAVTDVGVGGSDESIPVRVPSFNAWDLGVTYNFKQLHLSRWTDGLSMTVGVNNVANAQPPLAVNAFPDTNADVGSYDGAIGRMGYIDASYKF
jgi:iron complex outermembrane receptor protein